MNENSILSIRGVSKRFGGSIALSNVSFDVRPGHIHALMGENGAGKSTLIKIISGVVAKDSGIILFENKELNIKNPQQARLAGINVVYQELSLVPSLTVAENICAANAPMNKFKKMDVKNLSPKVMGMLRQFNINPFSLVKDLGIGAQQMVEIAGAVSRECKLLILDEPTAALTNEETTDLFQTLKELKEHGVTIIYISHKINEIFAIAEKITVLKDGSFVGTVDTKDVDEKKVVNMMVGRDLKDMFPPRKGFKKDVILKVENLSGDGFENISFELRRGEILGFAGLSGAGRTELFTAIFGSNIIESGDVYLENKKLHMKTPKDALLAGIGYLPEDRKQVGLFMQMNIKENTVAATIDEMSEKWLLDKKKIQNATASMIQKINIKTASMDNKVFSLSGGNQQKVILARWLLANPKVLIADEATRGVDVGAKFEIYQIIRSLAEQDMGIIYISSELPEIFGMCDRVIAMYRGKVYGEAAADNPDFEKIIGHAIVGIQQVV